MNFNFFETTAPGEVDLLWSLRLHGYEVQDVSADPNYWSKDIDLIATNHATNKTTTLEVKWDRCIAATGNMFIEIDNPRSESGNGWFKFCEADLLAYGDAVNRVFYFVNVADLRKYINKNELNLQQRITADGSKGYLIPLALVEDITECVVQV